MREKKHCFFRKCFFGLWLALPLGAELQVQVKGPQIGVVYDGTRVASYRSEGRVPCLYPLLSPTGQSVTRHFPFQEGVEGEAEDHPHHTSFWLAHGKVNGADFWHDGDNRIEHLRFVDHGVTDRGKSAFFTVALAWLVGEREILREERRYQFDFSIPQQTSLEVRATFTAVQGEVVFGDTKEGFCAIRVTPTLRLRGEVAQGHITDSVGRRGEDCWGQRAQWVAYHGPDTAGKALVVALLDHSNNLNHPTWWHARHYGLLAANPFGRHDFEARPDDPELGDFLLAKGQSFTQRYLLMLKVGEFDADSVQKTWQSWQDAGAAHPIR